MYHFFVSREQIGADSVIITGSDVNHMKNVLRMHPGEEILVSSGSGEDYRCRIERLTSQAVEAAILFKEEDTTELPGRLVLYQGLPKSDKMEWIIQKAVELGAYRIVPVETTRTVVKLDAKKEESKRRRWQAVSESAAKQSGRRIIPEISPVTGFAQALKEAGKMDMALIPFEHQEGMKETKEILQKIQPGMTVGIFIGPEGGFEEEEITAAREKGAVPITLGRRILRTETAGMAVLSVLMFQLES